MTGGKQAMRSIHLILAGIAATAIAVPVLVVSTAPPIQPDAAAHLAARPPRARSAAPPPVEPTRLLALAPADARSVNAAVPFSAAPNPAARPFRFVGAPQDLARATDCLAAAVLYEAGNDAPGERAVAQVVLNRLRHPAFPKTVCGVVFQGQERSTGCQFTFTCDGALARWRPTPDGWLRAREVAAAALAGSVHRGVGHATHYHTDWVVPYWSSSLDKVARVGTHLFFRWSGWWGTPRAFGRGQGGGEPAMLKLAALSPTHASAPGVALAAVGPGAPGVDEAAVMDAIIAAGAPAAALPDAEMTPDRNSFLMTLPATVPPPSWPELASRTCGDRAYCKVLGWTDAARTPKRLPLTTSEVASLSFSYLRDRAGGVERRLWNCRENRRPVPAQCMRLQTYVPAGEAAVAAAPPPARGPETLGGIRRREAEPPSGSGTAQPL